MKSASNTLPVEPDNGVTGGLDWSRDDHAVSVVDGRGAEVVRHTVEHTAAGLRELVEILTGARCHEVAIERPDGPLVEALLAAGLTVVVISPNQVKNLRGRYGSAGNKDDRFDAFVLADTLRTDRARLRPLTVRAENVVRPYCDPELIVNGRWSGRAMDAQVAAAGVDGVVVRLPGGHGGGPRCGVSELHVVDERDGPVGVEAVLLSDIELTGGRPRAVHGRVHRGEPKRGLQTGDCCCGETPRGPRIVRRPD